MYSFLSAALVLFLFCLIAFLITEEYTLNFFISFGFGCLAMVCVAVCSMVKRQGGLAYSYCIVTTAYVLVASVLNLCFIGARMESTRVNIILNAIIAVAFLVFVFQLLAAGDDSDIEIRDAKKRNYHYDMCAAVAPLRERGNTPKMNKKIEALYDAVSNSQININSEIVFMRDREIMDAVAQIDRMLTENSSAEEIFPALEKAISLVERRNEFVKNLYMRGL